MEPYCIVYTPPAFHLMELLGRISHPTELLSYLCGKDASRIDAGNYKDFLDGLPPLQRKGMSETLAIDCYTLTYVANLIARCGFRGKIILADGKRRTLGEAITARGGKPAAVFITAISCNFPAAVATALALNHGRIPVLLGGIHVSTSPHDVPTYIRRHVPFPELIAQVIGPADSGNMTQILGDLSTNALQETYHGRTSLENGIWGHVNVLPMAPLQLNHLKRIPVIGGLLARKFRVNVATPYTGCPFQCRFCSISTLARDKRSFTVRDPTDFIAELQEHQKNGRNAHNRFFFFLPDNLLLGGSQLEIMLDRLIAHGLNINFAAQISIEVANNIPLLRKLRRAGATHFFIGLESLDIRNLAYIEKHIAADIRKQRLAVSDYYRKQLRRIQEFGISVHGSFIFGLPYDYYHSRDDNTGVDIANFCVANHIGLQPSSLTDLPGSLDFRDSHQAGTYLYGRQGTWDYLVGLCIADLAEANRMPSDGLRHSPLLVSKMAYRAAHKVGSLRNSSHSALFAFYKAIACPTADGALSVRGRLEDGLFAMAAQLTVSQYRDHADMIALTHNGIKGTFERLYAAEADPWVRKQFEGDDFRATRT